MLEVVVKAMKTVVIVTVTASDSESYDVDYNEEQQY